jgi:hypothetical protein
MKTALSIALMGMILTVATAGRAQSAGQAATIGKIEVKEISVVEIDTTHVKVAVDLGLAPARSANLQNLRLCSLRLNGQPVFAAPFKQEIVLKKGEPIALPPLYVTLLFRDLDTVEPLSQVIEKQSVHLEGELVADLRVNFMERLILATQHPKVQITLDQEVPVQIGSTPFERGAALSILAVVDAGLKSKAVAAHLLPGSKPAWVRDLEAKAQSSVFKVESSYVIKQSGKNYPVHLDQLGFRLGSGEIVTTAEANEPWKYDAEFLGAVESGEAKLDKKSQEIVLAQVGKNSPTLSLNGKDFSVVTRGTAEKDSITLADGHGQVKVLRRDSPGSLSVLTQRVGVQAQGLTVAPSTVAAQDRWEQVAVFRLKIDPASKAASLEVLQLGAYREGKSIHLTESVDSAVFGSPIVTPDGVIGLVQDEQTGTFLPTDTGDALGSHPADR